TKPLRGGLRGHLPHRPIPHLPLVFFSSSVAAAVCPVPIFPTCAPAVRRASLRRCCLPSLTPPTTSDKDCCHDPTAPPPDRRPALAHLSPAHHRSLRRGRRQTHTPLPPRARPTRRRTGSPLPTPPCRPAGLLYPPH